MRALTLLLGVAVILMRPALTGAVCTWSVFGADACTTEACGAGCTVTFIGETLSVCYQGDSSCCACLYYLYSCDCLFGPGSGRVCVRLESEVGECLNGWCMRNGRPIMVPMPNPPEMG